MHPSQESLDLSIASTSQRPFSADLSAAVTSKAFTPPLRALPELIALLAGPEATAEATAMALRRMGPAVLPGLLAALPESGRPLRGRLTALVGRFVASGDGQGEPTPAQSLLVQLLDDADLKTQLNAVTALGRCRQPWSEQALLRALAKAPRRELQLALLRALGKVGAAATQAALTEPGGLDLGADQSAQRLLRRAQLILQREQSRTQLGSIIDDQALQQPRLFWLHCRDGLAPLLADEARTLGYAEVMVLGGDRVQVRTARPLADFWQLRLMTEVGLPFRLAPGPIDAAVGQALQTAVPLLHQLTRVDADGVAAGGGAVRYRIDWPQASRGQLWSMASTLMGMCPTLVNDPTLSTWDLCIGVGAEARTMELRPKRWQDPRFSYRQAYVPAASHPTIAAALARVAGVRAGDVVWDPFAGSGSELIECARSGVTASFYGTDSDPAAIRIAETNAAAASLLGRLHLAVGDFSTFTSVRPTLIVTNPPMGRRVQRGQVTELIDRFAAFAAAQLAPGGRLVWLAPMPQRSNPWFKQQGFRPLLQQTVDMGGFTAELQHLEKAP